MKKVICLYRVSTVGQVDHDDIPMQRLACREHAATHPDGEIIDEISEKGVSGYKVSTNARDAIVEIKRRAVQHEFDVLLVFMFDRLGRREDETPFVVQWFVQQGIEVWSTREGEQRFDTHVDKLLNYIRFWHLHILLEKKAAKYKDIEGMNRRFFGRSSEKHMVQSEGQLDFFNEVELEADKQQEEEFPYEADPELVPGKREQKRKPRTPRKEMFKKLAVEEEIIDLPEDQRIPFQQVS